MSQLNQEVDYMEPILAEKMGSVGPGAKLKAARELAGLTTADVAARLHLRECVIETIEKDEYEKTPSLVFVRGYLRSYAKLVELPADDIIAEFNQLDIKESDHIEPVKLLQEKARTSMPMLRWFTAICLFVLVVGVAMWWHAQKGQTLEVSAETTELLSAAEGIPSTTQDSELVTNNPADASPEALPSPNLDHAEQSASDLGE